MDTLATPIRQGIMSAQIVNNKFPFWGVGTMKKLSYALYLILIVAQLFASTALAQGGKEVLVIDVKGRCQCFERIYVCV